MGEGAAQPSLPLRWLFALIAVLAFMAGGALWLGTRSGIPPLDPSEIAPAALLSAPFTDASGAAATLGRFQGKVMVVNFWATWCAPCREEMPAFARLQTRWAGRGVQFVGLSAEEPEAVARFGREMGITYPLWVGGDQVGAVARRLGNRLGVLPFTVLIGPGGEVLERKVGAYNEADLAQRLAKIVGE